MNFPVLGMRMHKGLQALTYNSKLVEALDYDTA
jgi:hypothetical protein